MTTKVKKYVGCSGEVLQEVVNPNRTDACGCGVNVANEEWKDTNPLNYKGKWRQVRIRWEWLPDVVVPFGTDGKFRCGKCEIIG